MTTDPSLLDLVRYLAAQRYRFVAVTPATHARVLARPAPERPGLRDVFGWNRPFKVDEIDPGLADLMRAADILASEDGRHRSTVRVASLGEDLFLHSAYPTDSADAVFFGPDTYRFARFLTAGLHGREPARIVDMGAGSGAGGICAARLAPDAAVTLVDTNATALALARINARAAGVTVETVQSDAIPAHPDLVIANPPYMMDRASRAYRDGGDSLLGGDLSLAWVRDALGKLAPGGTMLLYTGAAYADGRSPLLDALAATCRDAGAELHIEELDPDVFGEELCEPAYARVERIAAVGATIRVPH